MNFKLVSTSALVASLSFVPVSPLIRPAMADTGDFVAGALVGVIGSAIVRDANKRKRSTSSGTRYSKSSVSSAQREANREVQTALNYFGYNVGTPDGAIGPKSRAGVSGVQALLGMPATGQLTDYERTILVTAHQRGLAGGPVISQTVAASPWGLKGLLLAQRDEMNGVAPFGTVAAAAPPQPFLPSVAPTLVAPATGTVAAATVAALPSLMPDAAPVAEAPAAVTDVAALPSFMGAGGAKGSLASHCNKVSLLTNTNGGYTTAAAMTDANFALSEQFCLARTYAMATGEELAAAVAGFTPEQITLQCAAFGPVLKDSVAGLSLKQADAVMADVQAFIVQSGMAPAQLSGTAKVCLGVGYTTDDLDVAIGSALLLTSLGEAGYAELLGHHLSQGYGANIRPDLAMGWYDVSLKAMEGGMSVFAPGLEGRGEVIRKAAYTINGRAGELATEAVVQEAALPVFEVAPEVIPDVQVAPEAVVDAVPEVAAPVAPVVMAPETSLAGAEPTAPQSTSPMTAGAEVAIMAARLPLLLLGSN